MTSAQDVAVIAYLHLIAHNFTNDLCCGKQPTLTFGTTTELQLLAAINKAVLTLK